MLWVNLLSGTLVFAVAYWLYVVHVRARHLKGLANPLALPIVGNMWQLRDASRFFLVMHELSRTYSAFFKIWIGTEPVVIVGKPDLLKEVLSSNYELYDRDEAVKELYDDIAGGLVLLRNGEHWAHDRKLLSEAFKLENLIKIGNRMPEHVDGILGLFEKHRLSCEAVNTQDLFQQLTFDLIGDIAMAYNFDSLSSNDKKYMYAFEHFLSYKNKAFLDPFKSYRYFTTKDSRESAAGVQLFYDLMRDVLHKRRELITEDDADIMATMVLANRNAPNAFSDEMIFRHIFTFLFAGHDTTTNQLTWMFYFLAQNPHVERKLHEEIDSVLGKRRPKYADLTKLTYLNLVMKETLRMRPSAPALGRELLQDTTLGGILLKKGQRLIYSPYIASHDPESFPDPEKFDPMRFADNARNCSPFSYCVFGAGARACIGKRLAETEIMMTTAMIAQKYRLRLVPGQNVEMEQATTMRARGGIQMTIESR